jgi:hypothetical protein
MLILSEFSYKKLSLLHVDEGCTNESFRLSDSKIDCHEGLIDLSVIFFDVGSAHTATVGILRYHKI